MFLIEEKMGKILINERKLKASWFAMLESIRINKYKQRGKSLAPAVRLAWLYVLQVFTAWLNNKGIVKWFFSP